MSFNPAEYGIFLVMYECLHYQTIFCIDYEVENSFVLDTGIGLLVLVGPQLLEKKNEIAFLVFYRSMTEKQTLQSP